MCVAPQKEGIPEAVCATTLIGFGDFEDWACGEIWTEKPHYAKFLFADNDRSCPDKKKVADWMGKTEHGILKEAQSSS